MFKKKEKTKDIILANILSGIELPSENEPIKKEILLKIIENIATEIAKTQKLASQSLYNGEL